MLIRLCLALFCIAFALFIDKSGVVADELGTQEEVDDPSVTVFAETSDGHVVCEFYLWADQRAQWASTYTGDPLSLKYPVNISELAILEQPEIVCDPGVDPELAASLSFAAAVLRHPESSRTCPWPVYPKGKLFTGSMSNGMIVILRVADNAEIGVARARMLDEVIDLQPSTPYEVAAIQQTGEFTDANNYYIEDYVAIQECRNLLAYERQSDQREALEESADLVARLLELYKQRNQSYPVTLCQLYTGDGAVVGAFLDNPFRADESLCVSEISIPKPKGGLRYIPDVSGEAGGDAIIIGYWLAVQSSGETVDPLQPLPITVSYPMRAVKWIEVHE